MKGAKWIPGVLFNSLFIKIWLTRVAWVWLEEAFVAKVY